MLFLDVLEWKMTLFTLISMQTVDPNCLAQLSCIGSAICNQQLRPTVGCMTLTFAQVSPSLAILGSTKNKPCLMAWEIQKSDRRWPWPLAIDPMCWLPGSLWTPTTFGGVLPRGLGDIKNCLKFELELDPVTLTFDKAHLKLGGWVYTLAKMGRMFFFIFQI